MSHDDNFVYLTFALLLLLLGTAAAQQFFSLSAQHLVQSATVVTLVVGVWGVDSKSLYFRQGFIFPIAIVLVALASYWLDTSGNDHYHLFLLLIFLISTAYQTSKQVLFSGEITGNNILGAICLYLLMGLIWATTYTLLQISFDQSFSSLSETTAWYSLFPDFVYFSFVTITTLGFGDISPTLPLARFFVYLEAIVGQFYLAILVASLVGTRMSVIAKENTKNK